MYRIYYTVFNNEGENQGNFLLYENFSDINKAISKANIRKNIFRDKILSITIKEHDLQDITYEKTVYRDTKDITEILENKYKNLKETDDTFEGTMSGFLENIDKYSAFNDIYDHLTDEEINNLLIKYGDFETYNCRCIDKEIVYEKENDLTI